MFVLRMLWDIMSHTVIWEHFCGHRVASAVASSLQMILPVCHQWSVSWLPAPLLTLSLRLYSGNQCGTRRIHLFNPQVGSQRDRAPPKNVTRERRRGAGVVFCVYFFFFFFSLIQSHKFERRIVAKWASRAISLISMTQHRADSLFCPKNRESSLSTLDKPPLISITDLVLQLVLVAAFL